jgi:transmembrane sensor
MNPPAKQRSYDAPAPVIRAAGAWLARRDRGFNAAEEAEFNEWRIAHPDHTAAVEQLEQTMAAFDCLKELVPAVAGAAEVNADYFAPRTRRDRRRFYPLGLVTLAAAAAIAVMFTLPAIIRDDGRERYSTTATVERFTLADGSVADLNRNSGLEIEFTDAERRLRLVRGEAHFNVAKNPARPFIVTAGNVTARAVGTAFAVRLARDRVEVLVTAGEVEVAPLSAGSIGEAHTSLQDVPSDAVVLGPGFSAVVVMATAAKPRVVQIESNEIARQLAWQPRMIELTNASLTEVVAEFNQRAAIPGHVRLVLEDPTLATLRIGGSIYIEQPEAFVRLLEKSFGIRAERHGDTITLRRAQ